MKNNNTPKRIRYKGQLYEARKINEATNNEDKYDKYNPRDGYIYIDAYDLGLRNRYADDIFIVTGLGRGADGLYQGYEIQDNFDDDERLVCKQVRAGGQVSDRRVFEIIDKIEAE